MNGWVQALLLLFVIGGYYDFRRDLRRLSDVVKGAHAQIARIADLLEATGRHVAQIEAYVAKPD